MRRRVFTFVWSNLAAFGGHSISGCMMLLELVLDDEAFGYTTLMLIPASSDLSHLVAIQGHGEAGGVEINFSIVMFHRVTHNFSAGPQLDDVYEVCFIF